MKALGGKSIAVFSDFLRSLFLGRFLLIQEFRRLFPLPFSLSLSLSLSARGEGSRCKDSGMYEYSIRNNSLKKREGRRDIPEGRIDKKCIYIFLLFLGVLFHSFPGFMDTHNPKAYKYRHFSALCYFSACEIRNATCERETRKLYRRSDRKTELNFSACC